ncbi:MAG: hypothetical protein CMF38_05095 [Legionellaceae bacterium]|nr:hypothetical protein [Legionellaceae bacterium]HAF87990.1 hypothetical protein [Legionellales bacterium]HCA89452.1 hypothetical protein [Legionellales bacterium]|tara:strand:+ start:682 stop:1086 length:405 start_codon:yes stop_codon:yes gene_type:complete
MLTLVLLLFVSTIVISFSQEISHTLKKIMNKPSMRLLLPLILISIAFILYEDELTLIILQISTYLTSTYFMQLTPIARTGYLITGLTLLSVVPGLLLSLWQQRYEHTSPAYIGHMMFFTWLTSSLLLSIWQALH